MKNLKLILFSLFSITLFAITSCKKEQASIKSTSWTFNYDWQFGAQGSMNVFFYSDNTTDVAGTWQQDDKDFTWTWNNALETVYTGTISGNNMTGTCSNNAGDSGTWSAVKD